MSDLDRLCVLMYQTLMDRGHVMDLLLEQKQNSNYQKYLDCLQECFILLKVQHLKVFTQELHVIKHFKQII